MCASFKIQCRGQGFFCKEEFFRWQSMNETSEDSKIFSYNKAEADYSISPPIQFLGGFLQRKYYGWKSAIYISIALLFCLWHNLNPHEKTQLVYIPMSLKLYSTLIEVFQKCFDKWQYW